MSRLRFGELSLIAVVGLAVLAPTSAQSPPGGARPTTKGRPLDQQLLDDLDRELLQGLPGGKRPVEPAVPPAGKTDFPPRPGTDAAAGEAAAIDVQNPLANVAQRMRSVESRIARHDTSAATQDEQNRIVSDLDALLAAAKQGRSGGNKQGSSGSARAGAGTGDTAAGPPRDSTSRIERGNPEPVETADVKDVLRRFWGHLPQKVRDDMQASLSEQFLPKYERVIEEYYKRLAEERPGGP